MDEPAARSSALDVLRGRFPEATIWYGPYTHRWWALARGRLLEAANPKELADRITQR